MLSLFWFLITFSQLAIVFEGKDIWIPVEDVHFFSLAWYLSYLNFMEAKVLTKF